MKTLIMLALTGLLFLSCSNDNSSSSDLSETPLAKAKFDNTNFGIYKGVLVGSTGVVMVNIKNNNILSATLIIDGTTYNFTTVEDVIENNDIVGLTFTSGNMSFNFNVSTNGVNPYTNAIVIPGHPNVYISLIKEKSTSIVKCYQGTYLDNGANGSTGVFNLLISGNNIYGLAASNSGNSTVPLSGTVSNKIITGIIYGGGSFSGRINKNNISGTFKNADSSETGTWSGQRTL
ncbi:hypothetical protein [Flavobacterium psychrotolerans]|nr:hypothetical protein [Flavobacterium psychrotolerans]